MIFLETKSEDEIELGDLIKLARLKGLYAHWAVYVGDGDVIHLSPPPSKSPAKTELCSALMATTGVTTITGEVIDNKLFGSIKVRRDKLKVVAAGSAIVVNNECDDEMKPYPRETIVRRAESKLGTNDYNIITWNCEHFATWCRYGKAVSKQVPFSKGLSKDAYLVQLQGVEVIPPGTLPDGITTKGKTDVRPMALEAVAPVDIANVANFVVNPIGTIAGIAVTALGGSRTSRADQQGCDIM